ncbi:hypothetical protein JW887_00260 [Candidatus Dojkabacteria bacterium]|nr:hypothetical protein [Candidatus Dojkabacteria bacterium]
MIKTNQNIKKKTSIVVIISILILSAIAIKISLSNKKAQDTNTAPIQYDYFFTNIHPSKILWIDRDLIAASENSFLVILDTEKRKSSRIYTSQPDYSIDDFFYDNNQLYVFEKSANESKLTILNKDNNDKEFTISTFLKLPVNTEVFVSNKHIFSTEQFPKNDIEDIAATTKVFNQKGQLIEEIDFSKSIKPIFLFKSHIYLVTSIPILEKNLYVFDIRSKTLKTAEFPVSSKFITDIKFISNKFPVLKVATMRNELIIQPGRSPFIQETNEICSVSSMTDNVNLTSCIYESKNQANLLIFDAHRLIKDQISFMPFTRIMSLTPSSNMKKFAIIDNYSELWILEPKL